MRKYSLLILIFGILSLTSSCGDHDDEYGYIRFISPSYNSVVKGTLTIQTMPALNSQNIQVWIERDVNNMPDPIMWAGTLTSAENYTKTVDISKFPVGQYEVKGLYRIGKLPAKGSVNFWVIP